MREEGPRALATLVRTTGSLPLAEDAVQALLALILLTDARRFARLDAAGDLVLLHDQDRAVWDRAAVREGVELLGSALRRTPDVPDRYAVQAAIAACHDLAPAWEQTDWAAIVSWYDVLLTVDDTPAVRVNRAVALAEPYGPAEGLRAPDDAGPGLAGYQPIVAAKGGAAGPVGPRGRGASGERPGPGAEPQRAGARPPRAPTGRSGPLSCSAARRTVRSMSTASVEALPCVTFPDHLAADEASDVPDEWAIRPHGGL